MQMKRLSKLMALSESNKIHAEHERVANDFYANTYPPCANSGYNVIPPST